MASFRREIILHAGVFLLCLANLMLELLLTRIFSVTMWYHFAFLAISVAVFGMTLGAIVVFQRPEYFTQEHASQHLAGAALLFALTIVLSLLVHVHVPVIFVPSLLGLASVALTFAVFALPFFFSGVAVCIVLTKHPSRVSSLYAADLAGAGSGCLVLIALLDATDAATAIGATAVAAVVAALLFASDEGLGRPVRRAFYASAVAAGVLFASVSTLTVGTAIGPAQPSPGGGRSVLYEKWNSFSRIRVTGDPDRLVAPFGWGISSAYARRSEPLARQLTVAIDAMAGTVMTGFDGDFTAIDYLRYDIVNVAHHFRQNASVLAMGVGGGRDVLSALTFKQKWIVGVEINQAILAAVNGRFGTFTGHLDHYPQVRFVNDDARSYAARTPERFDIIQIAMIDTWAATAAGAFVLTEHSLYTLEAWHLFLDRLTANGILTASRWYFTDRPGEVYRMTALAAAALMARGTTQPRQHIIVVKNPAQAANAVGTILVSNAPFSADDLDTLDGVARRLGFDVVLSPRVAADETLATLTSGAPLDTFLGSFPINIAPPTDDAPFFFQMLRLDAVLDPSRWELGRNSFNMRAVVILWLLLGVVLALTVGTVLVPLRRPSGHSLPSRAAPFLIFFAAIGFGFMLIEGALLQRLTIFLGHPTYSLSVVLCTLLLSSGAGSYLTRYIGVQAATSCLLSLLIVVGLCGLALPRAIATFESATTPLRMLVAILLVAPAGLCMGMAFPIGLKLATRDVEPLTPWLWGVNGATSVSGSVLAVVIALMWRISSAYWAGWGCYLVALAPVVWVRRAVPSEEPAPGRERVRHLDR